MKIELEVDSEQLAMLLTGIEGTFNGSHDEAVLRTEAVIERELKLAVETWEPNCDSRLDYEIVKMMPVYRQLIKYCRGDEPTYTLTGDADQFVSALLVARGEVAS